MFGKKLKKLGNSVTLDVLKGLPHGFLNFSLVCLHTPLETPYFINIICSYQRRHWKVQNSA